MSEPIKPKTKRAKYRRPHQRHSGKSARTGLAKYFDWMFAADCGHMTPRHQSA